MKFHLSFDLEIYDPVKENEKEYSDFIEDSLKKLEELFSELNSNKIKITCFATNEFIEDFNSFYHSKIVPYHEVSAHTSNHTFFNGSNHEIFKESILDNKKFIEKENGNRCIGIRSPGAIVPKNIVPFFIKSGFKYDSSVLPGIQIGRAFNIFTPRHPYYPDVSNIFKEGKSQDKFMEFPLLVSPILKLSINGFTFPYLFPFFKSCFQNSEITSYMHHRDYFLTRGKRFIWDHFKLANKNMRIFYDFIEHNRNCDLRIGSFSLN